VSYLASAPYFQELLRERTEAVKARHAAADRQQVHLALNTAKAESARILSELTAQNTELDTKRRFLQEQVRRWDTAEAALTQAVHACGARFVEP
jgi:fructose-specific component phosphotransferase system IIB-like protein